MRPSAAVYGLTLAAVAVAGLLRWLFDPLLGDHLPFVTFFVAVAVASWAGGLRPALLATGLGFVMAFFLVLPYSRMVHGAYRTAALLRCAIDKRTRKPLGSE